MRGNLFKIKWQVTLNIIGQTKKNIKDFFSKIKWMVKVNYLILKDNFYIKDIFKMTKNRDLENYTSIFYLEIIY